MCLYVASKHLADILEPANDDATYAKLVLVFYKLDPLRQFVCGREKDGFMARSQVNLVSALIWHLRFLGHLTHERSSTDNWADGDLLLRQLLQPQSTKAAKELLHESIADSLNFLQQELFKNKQPAEQQV